MTTTPVNDQMLAQAMHRGDPAAVRATYARFGRPVTTLAFGVLGDGDLAGEAVLSTFVRMAGTPERFEGAVDPAPLVFAMARSEVTDKWQAALEARRQSDASDSSSLGSIPIEAARSAWEIRSAIDRLDTEEQELLRLVHFGGLSPSQIVRQLGITPDELQRLSKEAHRRLASLLVHLDPDEQANLDRITELLRSPAMWADAGDGMATAVSAAIKANARTAAIDAAPADREPTPSASDEPMVISTKLADDPVARNGNRSVPDGLVTKSDLSGKSEPRIADLPLPEPIGSAPLSSEPAISDMAPVWGGSAASEPPVEGKGRVGSFGRRTESGRADREPAAIGPDPIEASMLPVEVDGPDGSDGSDGKSGQSGRKMNGTNLLALAAILVGLVMGIGTLIATQRGGSDLTSRNVTLSATELGPPGANASVLLVDAPGGVEVTMLFENLGAAPPDTYFQGWLHTIGDANVPIGSFHLRRGETRVTGVAGVQMSELAGVSVTLQPLGGPPEPADPMLVGTIGPEG